MTSCGVVTAYFYLSIYKMANESGFLKELREKLEEEVGGFWWKVHGGMFQMVGLPDLCGCVRGLYITIETKFGDNDLSDVQRTRLKQLREAGALAFAVWDNQLDYAIKRVKKYVEKHALQGTKESRKIIRKKKTSRIVYGARDWEDTYRSGNGRPKTKKTK